MIFDWTEPLTWTQPEAQETIIMVMRHGETFGNDASDELTYTYTGCHTDFPLNERGWGQAQRVADIISALQEAHFLKIAALYSSPLQRAYQSIQPLAKQLDLTVQIYDDLREIDWGIADGKLVKEIDDVWESEEKRIEALYPSREDFWDHFPVFPGSESFNHLDNRIRAVLRQVAEAHRGEVVMVSMHGRGLKCLIEKATDQNDRDIPYPKNCGIAIFKEKAGELKLLEVRSQ